MAITTEHTNENSLHHCWLVRHGQRLDELPNAREQPWFQDNENRQRYPLDPPLTEKGSEQANSSAATFLEKVGPDHGLTCIFVSPLHRTLKTSLEFAKKLNLPLVVVVGLAECTAACRSGPIVENEEGDWILPSRNNIFLTKQEIRELCSEVEISFHESNLRFQKTLNLLVQENPRCMCITHREGIRPLASYGEKLGYCHIQQVKFSVDSKNKNVAMTKNKTIFTGFKKQKK